MILNTGLNDIAGVAECACKCFTDDIRTAEHVHVQSRATVTSYALTAHADRGKSFSCARLCARTYGRSRHRNLTVSFFLRHKLLSSPVPLPTAYLVHPVDANCYWHSSPQFPLLQQDPHLAAVAGVHLFTVQEASLAYTEQPLASTCILNSESPVIVSLRPIGSCS